MATLQRKQFCAEVHAVSKAIPIMCIMTARL